MTEQDRIVVLEDNHRLRAENDTLRRERDEARRMYCEKVSNASRQYGTSAEDAAKQLRWDCYKKEETP